MYFILVLLTHDNVIRGANDAGVVLSPINRHALAVTPNKVVTVSGLDDGEALTALNRRHGFLLTVIG
jgi:hypothetical protein